MRNSSTFLILVVVLAACADRGAQRQPPRAPEIVTSTVDSPPVASPEASWAAACDTLVAAAHQLGETESAIRRRFGSPDSVTQRAPYGDYAQRGDSVLILHYPRLEIGLYRVLPVRRDVLGRVVLLDSSLALPLGLRVGAPVEEFLARLGPAYADSSEASLRYECGDMTANLTLLIQAGRVTRIEWTLPVD